MYNVTFKKFPFPQTHDEFDQGNLKISLKEIVLV